jgi:hypothetical protein
VEKIVEKIVEQPIKEFVYVPLFIDDSNALRTALVRDLPAEVADLIKSTPWRVAMLVRHDTSMLQQVVDVVTDNIAIPSRQANAKVYRERLLADARRLLALGAAIAIAAIGIGMGLGLASSWWSSTKASAPSGPAGIRATVSRIEREAQVGGTSTKSNNYELRDLQHR